MICYRTKTAVWSLLVSFPQLNFSYRGNGEVDLNKVYVYYLTEQHISAVKDKLQQK